MVFVEFAVIIKGIFIVVVIVLNVIIIVIVCKSNWTEWNTIQGVIGRVISNRPGAKKLLPELYDTKSNYYYYYYYSRGC